MSLDVKNLLIQDWMTTTAAVHDSTVAKAQIDSGQRDISIFSQTAHMIHNRYTVMYSIVVA